MDRCPNVTATVVPHPNGGEVEIPLPLAGVRPARNALWVGPSFGTDNQLGEGYLEAGREACQDREAWAASAVFDLGDVGHAYVGGVRELLLT